MDLDAVEARNVEEIEALNQRGGRMLSVVDLLAAGTLSTGAVAYLLLALQRGASFLVGARPGGAGKTAVMGALLGVVPGRERLVSVRDPAHLAELHSELAGLQQAPAGHESPRTTYICHEIGKGSWFGYLWGPAVKNFLALPGGKAGRGPRVASNLHADTLEELLDHLAPVAVGLPELRHVDILIFLRVFHRGHQGRGSHRIHRVNVISERVGDEYVKVYRLPEADTGIPDKALERVGSSRLVPRDAQFTRAIKIVNTLRRVTPPTIEGVRRAFLEAEDVLRESTPPST